MKLRHLLPTCSLLGLLACSATAVAGFNPAQPGLILEPDAKYIAPEGRTLFTVRPLGDITGDGRDDLVAEISPRSAASFGEELWVVPGSDRRGTTAITPENGALDLSPTGGAQPPRRIDPVGDINGDGVGDVAVWRQTFDGTGFGVADEIVLGGPGVIERIRAASSPLTITAPERDSVEPRPAGDVDGDGVDDLLIVRQSRTPRFDPGDPVAVGTFYNDSAIVVFGGSDLAALDVDALPASASAITLPETTDFESSFVAAGDVTGDGISDVVAHSPVLGTDPNASASPTVLTILEGGGRARRIGLEDPTALSVTLPVPQIPAEIEISDLNGDGVGDVSSDIHDRWTLFGSATLPAEFDHTSPTPGIGESRGSWREPSFGSPRLQPRVTANFGGRGYADVGVTQSSLERGNLVGLMLNGADGQGFGTARQAVLYPSNETLRSPIVADINGDGADDLVMTGLRATINGPRDANDFRVVFGGRRAPSCTPVLPTPEAVADLMPGISRLRSVRETGPRRATAKVTVEQLRENQQAAADAIRRLNALRDRLNAGIEGRDICGDTIGREHFVAGATVPDQALETRTAPDPRPLDVAEPGEAGEIQLTRNQLLINQRIYQAAIARANALSVRMTELTGGDITDGTLDARTLRAELGRPTGTAESAAASVTRVKTPNNKDVSGLEITVPQVEINYRIALEVQRRARNLQGRIETGLIAENFAPGSIGTADLAPAG